TGGTVTGGTTGTGGTVTGGTTGTGGTGTGGTTGTGGPGVTVIGVTGGPGGTVTVTGGPGVTGTGGPGGRDVIARGIAGRIALAAIASAAVGLVILAVGVAVVGADAFTELMIEAGDTAEHAREMYDDSVTTVVVAASVLAVVASIALAVVLARMLARPLNEVGAAARRVADGDYAARVPREGPEELASLADSFNQMAASLERQEAMRRDFIANAAHELRTPLTNLQGYLEALRDGVITADRATYESLHEEADRLVRLSRSLDALAEGDAGTSPPAIVDLDLTAVIGSAIDLATPALERAGLRLETDIPDQLAARADPDRLAQVLANLLSNAVRYTPAGGTVTVRAERRPGDVLISVANTGEGIPPDDIDRVFERFHRVEKSRDRARGGAGIGLAIVKQLVEQAGGRVGAESRDGLTRFWFSVPAA
ncbi:MAG: sensor histidine kinase, partial [Candidatus Limnocylindria bacterium]